jgi:carbon storage regulator
MLVLTRKRDQTIVIGDDIRIVIVAIEGNQTKIGIEAPRHISVRREEVASEDRE